MSALQHPKSPLTHEVHDQLAHAGAKDEVPHEVGDEGEGHAHQGHHQVADGQRQQEEVGDGAHAPVPHQHGDDEAVAQHAEEEDEAVEDDPHCLVDVWEEEEEARAHGHTHINSVSFSKRDLNIPSDSSVPLALSGTQPPHSRTSPMSQLKLQMLKGVCRLLMSLQ